MNWAWLKTLKNSPRNCRFTRSVMKVVFNRAKSQLLTPGPWKKRRFALPSWPSPDPWNELGSKKRQGPGHVDFRGSSFLTGATRFGVSTERGIGPPKLVPSKD